MDHSKIFELISIAASNDLILAAYKDQIKKLCTHFTDSYWAAMECRLLSDHDQVDFMLSFTWQDLVKQINAEESKQIQWLMDRKTFILEAESNIFLQQILDCIWLEYDIDLLTLEGKNKQPLFFIVFRPWHYDFLLLADLLYDLLPKAASLETSVLQNLHTCISQLNSTVQLYAIGFLESRQSESVRLVLKTRQFASIKKYLNKINWPGSIAQLVAQLDDLPSMADDFLFHLNVGPQIEAQLGVELCINETQRMIKLDQLLTRIVNLQLCDEKKKTAVLDWNGIAKIPSFISVEEQWIRYVNYVKIKYVPNKELEAKTYLFYKKLT